MLKPAALSLKELKTKFKVAEVKFRKVKGCSDCRFTGYKGRTAIHELMVVSDAIRALIIARTDANTIRKTASAEGLTTLRESAIYKLLNGDSSLEEVIRMTQLEN